MLDDEELNCDTNDDNELIDEDGDQIYCENDLCEFPAIKRVAVSENSVRDAKRDYCASCEESYSVGVQHGRHFEAARHGVLPGREDAQGKPEPEHGVERMLCVSTRHISKKASQQLDRFLQGPQPGSGYANDQPLRVSANYRQKHQAERDKVAPLIVRSFEYGWWVWVPDDLVKPYTKYVQVERSILNCLQHAKDLNCCYLLIDRDGTEHDELRKYSW
jgi:hypothetical protein